MTRPSTLHLRFPLGQTLALALALVVVIAGMAEGAARLLLDGSDRPTAIGSENPTLDVKIGMLDRLDAEGGVDCIFLGSSVVLNGLDPAAFAVAFRTQTGTDITCYNFGVPALTAQSAGLLAELLVERYEPRLLVYGFTLRAVGERSAQAAEVYDSIADTPWVAYQRGEANAQGWLVEHSTLLRHYLAYRNWPHDDYTTWRAQFTDAPPDGYEPFLVTRPFDPATIETPSYFRAYALSPAELDGLETILALSDGTQVLLVEMPLPLFVLEMFDGGAAGYDALLSGEIGDLAAAYDVPLWTTSALDLIPAVGWAEDAHHVNHRGAQLLSRWLAEQVAQAITTGELAL
ncbi:MAG: hypothetical protein GYB65_22850 [Chloroflexi bacterium]|nr:hypothetical protein [Chloroflexota bacterium]